MAVDQRGQELSQSTEMRERDRYSLGHCRLLDTASKIDNVALSRIAIA